MLQACLNGARSRRDHPRIPLTPDELAQVAAQVIAAGAAELHVHPRQGDGAETLDPGHTAEALTAIRAQAPGIPIGLTTHEGTRTDANRGFDQMKAWSVLPDYVSVNLSEEDAPQIIAVMLAKGVGIEAGLATVADARRFAALPAVKDCLRVLVEIGSEEDVGDALALADEIIALLRQHDIALPLLLHGLDQTMWPLYRKSLALGIDARLGFEDGIHLPDGRIALDNREIIDAARQMRPAVAT
jgi:uncharacterized protein (DUF849 family)